MKTHISLYFCGAVLMVAGSLAGCGNDAAQCEHDCGADVRADDVVEDTVNDRDVDEQAFAYCARQHEEGGMVVCDQLFEEAPYIRTPQDTPTWVYGAAASVEESTRRKFVTTSAEYDFEEVFAVDDACSIAYAYHLYRADISDGTARDLTPVLRVPDELFFTHWKGKTLRAGIGKRVGPDEFDYSDDGLTPAIVVLDDTTVSDSPALDDIPGAEASVVLRGRVLNLTQPARIGQEACVGALSDLGEANPFYGISEISFELRRVPCMHGFFDDVVTVDLFPPGNNMGSGFVGVGDLLRGEVPMAGMTSPHGVPWGGPRFDFELVEEAGTLCE